MTMCHLDYQDMTPKDFPSWDEWCRAVGASERYCMSLKSYEQITEFIGKCEPTDLPSAHPWWAEAAKDRIRKDINRHRSHMNGDPSQWKYFYNATTKASDIQRKIDELQSLIQ